MEYTTEIRCPKCNSTQLTSNTKGFSAGKAIGGAILTGGIGLFAGFLGSNKVLITCLACGKQFKAGHGIEVHISIRNTQSENKVEPITPKSIPIKNQYTKEEIEVKFRTWDRLAEKGLITKEELALKKKEFLFDK